MPCYAVSREKESDVFGLEVGCKRMLVIEKAMYLLIWTRMNGNLWHLLLANNYFVPETKFTTKKTGLFPLKVVQHQMALIFLIVMVLQHYLITSVARNKPTGKQIIKTSTTYVINYLQTNKKLVQENYKIYTWPDDDNKVQEQSQRRTPRPHTVSTNIFSVFKIVDKNID